MVTAAACIALALAVVCAPRPAAAARVAALWPVTGRARTWRPAAAAPVLLGALAGGLLAGAGGVLAGGLLASAARRRRSRARAARTANAAAEQLADAVGRITGELRAGAHPAAALGGVTADGPHARELLAPAAVAARLGDGVGAALARTADGHPGTAADLRRLAAAWVLAERHGIPLAELLAGVQHDVRWRVRFEATVRAQLAGPRATAAVLTALPVLGIALGQLMGADPLTVLRDGFAGQVLLVAGVGLATAGSAWTEQILRSAVPR